MTIHVHTRCVVTVEDRLLRRRYGCHRRGSLWFSDRGRVSRRVQRAIERALEQAAASPAA